MLHPLKFHHTLLNFKYFMKLLYYCNGYLELICLVDSSIGQSTKIFAWSENMEKLIISLNVKHMISRSQEQFVN